MSAIGSSAEQRVADKASTSEPTLPRWSLTKPRGSAPIFSDASSSVALAPGHVGQYYPLEEKLIPEAFESWYDNRGHAPDKSVPIDGGGRVKPLSSFVAGCTGLQYEFAQSYYPYVMYREAFQLLWDLVRGGSEARQQRLLMRGPPGAGKSILMAATAERLRQEDWIVMYVPDCQDVTHRNMFYSKNEETGMFDTRDAAQNILRSMLEAHGERLRDLPQQLPDAFGSLFDLCNQQESVSDDVLCNAVVRLKLELYRLPASVPSAVVLDSYNALFWRTDMFDALSWDSLPRRIDAQELTLGANLRALADKDIGSTTVLASVCMSGDLPDIPMDLMAREDAPLHRYTLPLMDIHELGSMLLYYRFVHALAPAQKITESGVKAAHQLTQGDGKAVRTNLHFLLPYDASFDDMDAVGEAYSNVDLFALQSAAK